jgi:O-antigen chain-terminating methyltransferase
MTSATTDARRLSNAERIEVLEAQVRELVRGLADASQRVAAHETDLRALRAKVDGSGPRFAALYPDFIDRFRGSTAEVTAKLAGYLPDVLRLVDAAGPDAETTGVVDVGSGRGEWLALLRDAGVPASGVDANPRFVEAAQAQGLDVVHGDAVAHLQDLPPNSVDMVTAFHLIENCSRCWPRLEMPCAPEGACWSRRPTRATCAWLRATSTTTRHTARRCRPP